MESVRKSGVLLHPTSLPGPYGVGEIGAEARRFVDALEEMGQRRWQILPHGPTSYGDSPYQSLSTFAGNPLLISFDGLVNDGLLRAARLREFPRFPDDTVEYGPVIAARTEILRSVCRTFARRASDELIEAFRLFCEREKFWLDDFALYSALKEAHELRPWIEWPEALALREPAALADARKRHRTAIRNAKILQFLFDHQWRRLRNYAHKKKIRLIGDIPIFVAHDSADVWAHPELFHLDAHGLPTVVAGVPPDYFSATGQRWGNPLYNWDQHRATGYRWWIRRLRKIFAVVDLVRIDHFRGFAAYWEIPADEPTATNGHWVEGPGGEIFDRLLRERDTLPIIAEDLGVITEDVHALREQYGFPGMRILQFAFGDEDAPEEYRPESYPVHCVVYTGTHDNDTTVGWFWSAAGEGSTRTAEQIEKERARVLAYTGTDGREIHWDLITLACDSNGETSIYPLQDLLGLGSEARMNTPGVERGNWRWRFTWAQLTPGIRQRMLQISRNAGRVT